MAITVTNFFLNYHLLYSNDIAGVRCYLLSAEVGILH